MRILFLLGLVGCSADVFTSSSLRFDAPDASDAADSVAIDGGLDAIEPRDGADGTIDATSDAVDSSLDATSDVACIKQGSLCNPDGSDFACCGSMTCQNIASTWVCYPP